MGETQCNPHVYLELTRVNVINETRHVYLESLGNSLLGCFSSQKALGSKSCDGNGLVKHEENLE